MSQECFIMNCFCYNPAVFLELIYDLTNIHNLMCDMTFLCATFFLIKPTHTLDYVYIPHSPIRFVAFNHNPYSRQQKSIDPQQTLFCSHIAGDDYYRQSTPHVLFFRVSLSITFWCWQLVDE